jgi:hypothetical protein
MVQRGHGAGFTFEALGELLLRNFEGNRAVEPGVAGALHFAHPSSAEQAEDLV